MKKRLLAITTAVTGGLLFWRRKSIKGDASRVASAAQRASESAWQKLEDRFDAERAGYVALGRLVYQVHANPGGGDRQDELDEMLAELDDLIAQIQVERDTIDLTEPARTEEPALP